MLRTASTSKMLAAMDRARSITLSAYSLPPGGRVLEGLEAAAKRGARVTVRLNGCFAHGGAPAMLERNRTSVRALQTFGADASLLHTSDADGPSMHLKAAVCDGVAFLDDRNWIDGIDNTVLADTTPSEVRAIRTAARGSPERVPPSRLQLDKAGALAQEARLLRRPCTGTVEVATESIGRGSLVYGALRDLALAGKHPHLLISRQGTHGLDQTDAMHLQRLGVRVRVSRSCEKFAIDGSRVWVGSANATTPALDDSIDWGISTAASGIVRRQRSRFSAEWAHAREL